MLTELQILALVFDLHNVPAAGSPRNSFARADRCIPRLETRLIGRSLDRVAI